MTKQPKKNPAAVSLGRKGGRASTAKLTPEQRQERARKAAEARWGKPRIGYLDPAGQLHTVRGVTLPNQKRKPKIIEFAFTPDETMVDKLTAQMQSVLIELNGEEMPGRWSASDVVDNGDGTVTFTLKPA